MRRKWTDNELDALRRMYPDNDTAVIAAKLGRSVRAVYVAAGLAGLKKSRAYLRETRDVKITAAGIANRIKPGSTPHNKGKAAPWAKVGNCAKGHFRKGNLPPQTKHDGWTAIRHDKTGKCYLYVRVSLCKMIPVHHKVWTDANGALPKGSILTFRDGDTLNCELSNLRMVTRAEAMKDNTIHRYPKELVLAMKRVGKIKKLLKQNGKEQAK